MIPINPKQMSIGNCQIPAGPFNPDDKFGFGFRRFDDQKRSINKNSVFHKKIQRFTNFLGTLVTSLWSFYINQCIQSDIIC
jgi:hypothetical protein